MLNLAFTKYPSTLHTSCQSSTEEPGKMCIVYTPALNTTMITMKHFVPAEEATEVLETMWCIVCKINPWKKWNL